MSVNSCVVATQSTIGRKTPSPQRRHAMAFNRGRSNGK